VTATKKPLLDWYGEGYIFFFDFLRRMSRKPFLVRATLQAWMFCAAARSCSFLAGVPPQMYHITIEWKPFFLRTNMPVEGQPKGGTPASRAGSGLQQAGASVGIYFTGFTDRTPNTALFHATLKHLQNILHMDSRTVTECHEAVFEGYYTLGIFPDQAGILKGDNTFLPYLLEEVTKEAMEASRNGISGVPIFAFNGEEAFSGAQPVDTFIRHLEDCSKSSSEY
jgi:predicted DsbA family dithiol-disulfide isomerase